MLAPTQRLAAVFRTRKAAAVVAKLALALVATDLDLPNLQAHLDLEIANSAVENQVVCKRVAGYRVAAAGNPECIQCRSEWCRLRNRR